MEDDRDKSYYTPHKDKLKMRVYRRSIYLPSKFYNEVVPPLSSYKGKPTGIYSAAPKFTHTVFLANMGSHYVLIDANDKIGRPGSHFEAWQGEDMVRPCMVRGNCFNDLTGAASEEYGVCSLVAMAAYILAHSWNGPDIAKNMPVVATMFASETIGFTDFEEMDSFVVNHVRRSLIDKSGKMGVYCKAYVTDFDRTGGATELFRIAK